MQGNDLDNPTTGHLNHMPKNTGDRLFMEIALWRHLRDKADAYENGRS